MFNVEIGDKLLKVGKPYKYLTNGKVYKVVLTSKDYFYVIDDEDEELMIRPKFYYERLRKIFNE